MIRKEFVYAEPFACEAGGCIDRLKVTYHISQPKHEAGREPKVVWICHALTANSDPTDWWPDLVGPGKFFDTQKFLVVCANMLGSPYGSSGPLTYRAEGRDYFSFPKVTVRDMVRAWDLLREHLGIKQIDLLVGGSIGGFQAIEWAVSQKGCIRHAAFIACSARVSPWLTASNEAQRMAIEADPTFFDTTLPEGGMNGLRAARAEALISYRSYEGYGLTQAEEDPDCLFASRAASYERYQGKKLSDRFDARSYSYLTYAVDSHNLGRGRGGVEKALSTIRCKSIVIGIDSDGLFPLKEQRLIAEHIEGASFHTITSRFGHDGFLLEYDQISRILREECDLW